MGREYSVAAFVGLLEKCVAPAAVKEAFYVFTVAGEALAQKLGQLARIQQVSQPGQK